MSGKIKKVYLLFENKNWDGEENYSVVDVFEKKEDACKELEKMKNDFLSEWAAEIEETKEDDPDSIQIEDEKTKYRVADNVLGAWYSLSVTEEDVK